MGVFVSSAVPSTAGSWGAVCRRTPDISFLWAARCLKRGLLYLPEGYRSACWEPSKQEWWEAGWCCRSAPWLTSSPAQLRHCALSVQGRGDTASQTPSAQPLV